MSVLAPTASPIHVRRLPPARLMPLPEEPPAAPRPDDPMPVTSPQRPWDRVAISTADEPVPIWLRTDFHPEMPLPAEFELEKRVVGKVLVHAIEVLLGHRPCSQLRNWLSPQVFSALSRRAGLAMRIHGRAPRASAPRVRHVHLCEPRQRVCEASVVLHDGQQIRGAALRLEFIRDRWRVVALEIG
ncbi:Rv3235 family protein [Ancrocorticia populi]|nr:Rv3235 family protein [Ancrocorticia populi]MDN6487107.1 Rv3235 family protein [Ancrocorticia sp.]